MSRRSKRGLGETRGRSPGRKMDLQEFAAELPPFRAHGSKGLGAAPINRPVEPPAPLPGRPRAPPLASRDRCAGSTSDPAAHARRRGSWPCHFSPRAKASSFAAASRSRPRLILAILVAKSAAELMSSFSDHWPSSIAACLSVSFIPAISAASNFQTTCSAFLPR